MYVIILFFMNIYIKGSSIFFFFEMQRIFIVNNSKFFMHIFCKFGKTCDFKGKILFLFFFSTLLFLFFSFS